MSLSVDTHSQRSAMNELASRLRGPTVIAPSITVSIDRFGAYCMAPYGGVPS